MNAIILFIVICSIILVPYLGKFCIFLSVHRTFQVFICLTMADRCQTRYSRLEDCASRTANGHVVETQQADHRGQQVGTQQTGSCDVEGQQTGQEKEQNSNCCVKVLNFIFTFLCWLCGLYFGNNIVFCGININNWLVTICQFLTFVVMFLVCMCHFAVAIALEVCRITNSSCVLIDTDNCTLPHEYWKISAAVTLSTFAASLSYILMTVFILIPANKFRTCCQSDDQNILHQICCTTVRKLFKDKGAFLSPFNVCMDDGLTRAQRVCFFFNYLFSLSVFAIYTTASIVYAGLVDSKFHCMINDFNLAWYVLHAIFHFCAIHSCFIFSKVIYIATNKLEQLLTEFDKVNESCTPINCNQGEPSTSDQAEPSTSDQGEPSTSDQGEPSTSINCDQLKRYMPESDQIKEMLESGNEAERNNGQYYLLQNIYLDFVKQVKPTLDLLGYWFIAHWLLHALTTVLLSAVVVELVVHPLQYKMIEVDKIINIEDDGLKAAYLVYLIFFALEHAYLFVYPCFRAASVAVARVKLTNAVLKKRWRHISLYVTNSFVQYLTSQNFAFKVSIFCAELSFGLSMACVSLILALYGGLIKLND